MKYESELVPLEQSALLEIADQETLALASECLTTANRIADQIEAEKAKVMRPLLDAVNAERARWKPYEDRIKPVIAAYREKIAAYQTKITKEAAAIQAQTAKDLTKGSITFTRAIETLSALEVPQDRIQTQAGSIAFRTVKKWRITNAAKIPRGYLTTDDAKITSAMKSDTKVPGIEYFEEQVPVSYR